MIKKIIIAVLVLYVVVTSAYFLNKGFKLFSKNKVAQPVIVNAEEIESDCPSFAIGHIAGNKFRIYSRFLKSVEKPEIDEKDLQQSIAKATCDRAGQTALIYYDSVPIALATVESYDYSKPFGDASKDKPVVYTVLALDKKLDDLPESGYIVAVFNFDPKNMNFYKTIDLEVTPDDEQIISGSADTIYYQVIGKDPVKTEVEYSSIKTDLNTDGIKDMAVLTTWTDPELPKNVHYIAVFNLHKQTDENKNLRYPVFPITKIRKSKFYLFQVVDVDNDGYKETILRKERNGEDTFLVYKYNRNKDAYVELTKSTETD